MFKIKKKSIVPVSEGFLVVLQFMLQIIFNFNNFIFNGVSATAWQRAPAAYAVVAGGCDWPLPSAVGLSNNDVIVLRPLRCLRCVRCVGWKPRLSPQGLQIRRQTLSSLRHHGGQILSAPPFFFLFSVLPPLSFPAGGI